MIGEKHESGEKVRLDATFRNTSIVTVVNQTPKRLITRVKSDDGDEWDVMTYRLTKILNSNLSNEKAEK